MTGDQVSVILAEANPFVCYGVGAESELIQLGLMLRYLATLDGGATHTPQELIQTGRTYSCYAPMTIFTTIKLAILRLTALALAPTADVTPGAVMVSAMNIGCLGASIADIIEVGLMDLVATNA